MTEYEIKGPQTFFQSQVQVGISSYDPSYKQANITDSPPTCCKDCTLKVSLDINLAGNVAQKTFYISKYQSIDPSQGINIRII